MGTTKNSDQWSETRDGVCGTRSMRKLRSKRLRRGAAYAKAPAKGRCGSGTASRLRCAPVAPGVYADRGCCLRPCYAEPACPAPHVHGFRLVPCAILLSLPLTLVLPPACHPLLHSRICDHSHSLRQYCQPLAVHRRA